MFIIDTHCCTSLMTVSIHFVYVKLGSIFTVHDPDLTQILYLPINFKEKLFNWCQYIQPLTHVSL